MDDAPIPPCVPAAVPGDRLVHFLQQVETPMNIADRIDADAVRPLRVEEVNAFVWQSAAHHDQMQSPRAVHAKNDLLLDVVRARRAGNEIEGACHVALVEFPAKLVDRSFEITFDI